jgi:hypothetical protein
MVFQKTRTKNSEEKAAALYNAQKPHAARAAFAQPIYYPTHWPNTTLPIK